MASGKEQAQNLLLKNLIFGDDLTVDMADVDEMPNPFEKRRHDAAVRAMLGKASDASCAIDLPLPPSHNVDTDDEPFLKSPQIVPRAATPTLAKADAPPRTLAQKLGIVRSETVKTESGDLWLHGFNEKNELVDARILEAVAE